MSDNDRVLPVAVDSLSDYAPDKLHQFLATSAFGSMSLSDEQTPVKIDSPSKSTVQKSNSFSSPSRRRSIIRYFFPNNRSRLSSVQLEQDESITKLSNNTCDMRLFIIRHGERVDRYFGPHWHRQVFDQNKQYRPYHRNFPSSLPARSNNAFWGLDCPLTTSGLKDAERLGRALRSKNHIPTYVYSSPAVRCIQTTLQILKGLALEQPIAIRIEPGLLELGAARYGMNIFYQAEDWAKYGIHVDLTYQPIVAHVPAFEREDAYYFRSKHVVRELEKRHQRNSNQCPNLFIIAHATSPDTLTWDLVGRRPNANDLYTFALKIAYLQTMIAERRQTNKSWLISILR